MKRWVLLFFLLTARLQAQTGEASLAASQEAEQYEWGSWIFAASSVVVATLGILAVTMDSGASSHS